MDSQTSSFKLSLFINMSWTLITFYQWYIWAWRWNNFFSLHTIHILRWHVFGGTFMREMIGFGFLFQFKPSYVINAHFGMFKLFYSCDKLCFCSKTSSFGAIILGSMLSDVNYSFKKIENVKVPNFSTSIDTTQSRYTWCNIILKQKIIVIQYHEWIISISSWAIHHRTMLNNIIMTCNNR